MSKMYFTDEFGWFSVDVNDKGFIESEEYEYDDNDENKDEDWD